MVCMLILALDFVLHGPLAPPSRSGSRYDGQWKDGMREGRGTFCFANGAQYSGRFHYDKMDGSGARGGVDALGGRLVYEGARLIALQEPFLSPSQSWWEMRSLSLWTSLIWSAFTWSLASTNRECNPCSGVREIERASLLWWLFYAVS